MTNGTFIVRSLHDGSVTAIDARSDRSFARHAHDEFGIGLVTNGAQRSWSGRGHVEASRGNLITVNPSEMHDGSPIGAGRSWSMLYFSQEIVNRIVSDITENKVSKRELHAPVVAGAGLADLFISAREAALDNDSEAAFEERMLVLFGVLFDVATESTVNASCRIVRVRDRIDDDPAGSHPLTELAELAGLSRFQTVRAFARLTGCTPHAYVTQRRIYAARRLIRNGSSLADAAVAAGFADQSHMHRFFTARHGFTPGAYAEAHRQRGATSFKRMTGL